jgi:hypothetical protein
MLEEQALIRAVLSSAVNQLPLGCRRRCHPLARPAPLLAPCSYSPLAAAPGLSGVSVLCGLDTRLYTRTAGAGGCTRRARARVHENSQVPVHRLPPFTHSFCTAHQGTTDEINRSATLD